MIFQEQLLTVFIFGFAGSFHCAAMCGPLAAAACQHLNGKSALQYHLSRIMAYTILGACAGLIGLVGLKIFILNFSRAGQFAGILFGCISLFYALRELRTALLRPESRGDPVRKSRLPDVATNLSRLRWNERLQRLLLNAGMPRAVVFGFITALLPCGFLAVGILQAGTLAHPAKSAAAMALFALATTPALWGGAGLVMFVRRLFPQHYRLTLAVLLVIVASIALWRAWPAPGNVSGEEPLTNHHHH